MKKKIPATIVFFCVLAFSLSGCDTGGNGEYEFSDWDQDGNELLDKNEFFRAYAETNYHSRWDTDEDKFIDQEEWESGVTSYWVAYDIAEHGAFSTWDPDINEKLPEDEFREKIFEFYDKDGDGFLNKEEYQSWYSDVEE